MAITKISYNLHSIVRKNGLKPIQNRINQTLANLKKNEELEMSFSKEHSSLKKIFYDCHLTPAVEKEIYSDGKDSMIICKMNSNTYNALWQKYDTGEMYFTRKHLQNGSVKRFVEESKHKGRYKYTDAQLDGNVLTIHKKESNLNKGQSAEYVLKKYYDTDGSLLQVELYNKDNRLVEKNICFDNKKMSDLAVVGSRITFQKLKADGTSRLCKNVPSGYFCYFDYTSPQCFKNLKVD